MQREVGPKVVLREMDMMRSALLKWQRTEKGIIDNMTFDEAIVASLGILYRYYMKGDEAPSVDYKVYIQRL